MSDAEPHALVVGGTGPTGPYVIDGLLARGYRVTMVNSGRHDTALVPDSVRRLHADVFSKVDLDRVLDGMSFDLAVVTYGRLREIVDLLAGRVAKLVTVGGDPVYLGYGTPEALSPPGLRLPAREFDALSERVPSPVTNTKVSKMVLTEDAVFALHPTATHFRYPTIYGPRQVLPREWMIIRRLLDGRRKIILADHGQTLRAVAYAENAAAALLAAVDAGEVSAGQTYNVADDWTPTIRQAVELVCSVLGRSIEIVSMPYELATPAHPLLMYGDPYHRLITCDKILHQLGHTNPVLVPEAFERTVNWLVANPPDDDAYRRDSSDRFDYEAEDRLIDAWESALAGLAPLAAAADSGMVNRYHASFDAIAGPRTWVMPFIR